MDGKIICPRCRYSDVVKGGKRKVKFGERQTYLCKNCGKRFTLGKYSHKTYPGRVINTAISLYNLGYTLDECKREGNKRFKVSVGKSTISNWVNEYRRFCSYYRIRDDVVQKYGKEIVVNKVLRHKGLTYRFKYHKPKLEMFCSKYPGLVAYLKGLESGVPDDFFDGDERCSQLKIDIDIKKQGKRNHACKLTEQALQGVEDNRWRHVAVEEFMLVNDTSTIAVEVPVWFWEKTLDTGITGHIDILQVRYGKIYVLDFKPDAGKEKNAPSQLYLYALGLSFRTGIALKSFICGWFDEEAYYEFAPSEAKVEWQ